MGNDYWAPQSVEEEAIKLVPNILSTCNCLHIALLVYLRLITITEVFKYKETIRQHRHKSIALMWLISVGINTIPVLAAGFEHILLKLIFKYIILYAFHACPIIFIVVEYSKLIRVVEERNRKEAETRMSEFSHVNVNFLENAKLSTKIIKGVVVCLIFCYLPYLAWWQYAMIVFPRWHLMGDPICCKQISVKPEEVNMPV